ncbi:hypothetical protein KSS87_000032 [Heliosperma pusillum]|nr:hypothetical protein KSS87_000032 [Heliosperma pusillum]
MAFSPKTLLALITLLVVATSQAHGLLVGNLVVNTLIVNTGLRCQLNPASLGSNAAPLTNVTVILLLNNQPIANATTDLGGTSLIMVNTASVLASIRNITSLKVRVTLPIVGCSVLATPTGTLEGPLQFVNFLNSVLTLVATTIRITITFSKGGNYNPLTILASAISGGFSNFLFIVGARIPAQVLGAIYGVRLLIQTFPSIGHGPKLNVDIHHGALTEGLLTFITVFISMTLSRTIPESFVRKTWISSLSKLTLQIIGSDLTGGIMNSASVTGWAYARGHHITKEHIIVYWLAPIEGTLLAVWISGLLFQKPKEKEDTKKALILEVGKGLVTSKLSIFSFLKSSNLSNGRSSNIRSGKRPSHRRGERFSSIANGLRLRYGQHEAASLIQGLMHLSNPITPPYLGLLGGFEAVVHDFMLKSLMLGANCGVRLLIHTLREIGHRPKLNVNIHHGAPTEGLLTFMIVFITVTNENHSGFLEEDLNF